MINFISPIAEASDQTHIWGKEVRQSINSSRQSEGTDQEDSQHQVGESSCHIHSLKHGQKLRILHELFLHLGVIISSHVT